MKLEPFQLHNKNGRISVDRQLFQVYLWLLAVGAHYMFIGAYLFNLVKLLETIFEIDVPVILDVLILRGLVLDHLADLMIIIFFDER